MRKLKLSSLKGLEKFRAAMLADGQSEFLRWFKSKKKSKPLMDEVHKHIFDLGPPTPPGKRTGRINHHQLLMYYVSDIQTTIDTMTDIEFYIRQFPYSEQKIAKHRHLQFHVEAFLNELYILQERLLRFLKFIERQYKRDPRIDHIKAACKVLNDWVIDSMRKAIAMRGSHVHKWRWSRYSDDIDRLGGIDLYTKMPSKKIQKAFKAYYESEYRKVREKWREWIADLTGQCQKLVDSYFDEVFKLIFDGNGRLLYPSRLKF